MCVIRDPGDQNCLSGPQPDSGIVQIRVNGTVAQVSYGQGSTDASIASALCSAMGSSFPAQCTGVTTGNGGSIVNFQGSQNFPIIVNAAHSGHLSGSPSFDIALNPGLVDPKYYILSVLYAPPGNRSSNGFTNTTSNGVSTSIGSSFAQGTTTTFTITSGFGPFTSSSGVSFGVSNAVGSSQSFQITYQSGSGTAIQSNRNPVDHTQDQFYLWLNPEIAITQTGTSAAVYRMQTQNGEPMDIINIVAADLQNPSQIPLSVLEPQTVAPGVTLPGLSSICANPLPPSQCTTTNACGCVPGDFTAILAADPLLSASPNTPPSQVVPNRYVLVNATTLEGPQCAGCDLVANSFTQSDSQLSSQTFTTTTSYSEGFSRGFGFNIMGFGLSVTDTNTFTFTNTESQGTSNGTAHQASVTLESTNVGCFETIDIYEDTVYHTYAFAPATTPPAACQ